VAQPGATNPEGAVDSDRWDNESPSV
jgi:hypothetical protein